MRRIIPIVTAFCVLIPALVLAENAPFDAAAAFGARPSASDVTVSPDGQNLAWIAPAAGQGSTLYTLALTKDAKPRAALTASGSPERLDWCRWASNSRLVCRFFYLQRKPELGIMHIRRLVAVNSDGSNLKSLSTQQTEDMHVLIVGGGAVIDWLAEPEASVLMTRVYGANDHIGSRLGSDVTGLAVDRLDTITLESHRVEPPNRNAIDYIADGRGRVRIVANREVEARQATGIVRYEFHPVGSDDWQPLSQFQNSDGTGFVPEAVDPEHNLAYGFKKLDGRFAVYTVALDSGRSEQLVYANPEVDVDELVTLGPQQRVVGANYYTNDRHAEYFAPDVKAMVESLTRALHTPPHVVDASRDGNHVLVETSSDVDPGVFYLFDRTSHQLQTLFVVRNQLEGVKLASVRSVTYPAADGAQIPGYLTLPPGVTSPKGLPALVMPHGGFYSRDVWGFDWVAQFFANRGFAVLQPNFRGSGGYGDAWLQHSGLRAWKVAISDVLDGGRWLVKEGVDPARLGIFGRNYGGYAALQSAATDPDLFKAVIAVSPVTDLAALKEQYRHSSNFSLTSDWIGDGPQVREGSPAEHADRIRVPVLLFHGAFSWPISIEQSQRMQSALKSSGGKVTLVTWDALDEDLQDSTARAEMLSKSDAFLRAAFGM